MTTAPAVAGRLATLDPLSPEARLTAVRAGPPHPTMSDLGDELEALAATDLAAAERVITWLVPLADELGGVSGRARVRRAAAHALTYAGRPDEALASCREAHLIAADGRELVEAARATLAAVHPLAMLGRFEEAITDANDARTQLADLGRADLAARADLNLGAIFAMLERIPEAVASFDRARPSLVEEPSLLAQLESNAGVALIGVGRFDDAADALTRAITAFEEAGQPLAAAIARGNLAHLLVRRGSLAHGVALYERVDAELETTAAPPAQRMRILAEQAAAFGEVGLAAESAELASRAIHGLDEGGMALDAGIAHVTLASALITLGDIHDATRAADEASRRLSAIGNEAGAARADLIVARLLLPADPGGALDAVGRRAAVRSGRPLDELDAALVSADILLAQGDPDGAASQVARGEIAASAVDYLPGRAEALHLTGRIRQATGSPALWPLRGAVAATERLRRSFGATAFQGAVQTRFLGPYLDLIREAVVRDRPAEAFWVAERCKQRQLALTLGPSAALASGPDDQEHAIDPHRRDIEGRLGWRYAEIAQSGLAGEVADVGILREIAGLERELSIIDRRREAERLDQAQSITRARRLDHHPTLPEGAVGLSYIVLSDAIVAFVVGGDGASIESVITPLNRGDLHNRLAAFRFQMTRGLGQADRSSDPRLIAAASRASATLYDLILRPVAALLPNGAHIVISPHGPLHVVPFAALRDDGSVAGDRWTLSVVPNLTAASRLADPARRPGPPLLVGAGDDAAPAISREIDALRAEMPGATTLVGDEATVQRVSDRIADAGDVHIASHGHFSAAAPRSAGLRLADGWLTAGAIQRLPLHGAHVTLSGCETGAAARSALDDDVGLPAALLAAGATSMLVSHWPAHDHAATHLMTAWYRARATGEAPALALQTAQADTRRDHPHPALWAAFYVGGTA